MNINIRFYIYNKLQFSINFFDDKQLCNRIYIIKVYSSAPTIPIYESTSLSLRKGSCCGYKRKEHVFIIV